MTTPRNTFRKRSINNSVGITLIAILLLLLVCAILVGLLLPSLQKARESARLYSTLGELSAGHVLVIEEQVSGQFNTEQYDRIYENPFLDPVNNPLSTFSIDVDVASYSNSRRFIRQGKLPPKDAVRIEEFINYFTYEYPQPQGEHPFSITTEIAECPWNRAHKLVHIGLQGEKIAEENLPPGNIVFLLDVSGSMMPYNKLPLLKGAMKLLIDRLREQDSVAIVVYAGAAGCVLPATKGGQKDTILNAIEGLEAGGTTAGAAGINLAYKIAKQNYIKGGNNRVILATDGDFNVGVSSDGELIRLVEEKREDGIFLTVLGFGEGNLKDSKMEKLADKGNGNYAYIDSILEAKKVLVSEMGGTLYTIAKDVKIQVEFNPANLKAYRLIGYENRLLRDEDFNDDTKDAGELGSGHTVTALYEIVPAGSDEEIANIDPLKYQTTELQSDAVAGDELMTVKFRYKDPDGAESKLIVQAIKDGDVAIADASRDFRFSAAVAEFGLMLRDSRYKANATYEQVLDLAQQAKGNDENGYRSEFVELVGICSKL